MSTYLLSQYCCDCCVMEVLAACVNCDPGQACTPPLVCAPSSYITTDIHGRFFVNANFPPTPPLCYPKGSVITVNPPPTYSCGGEVYDFITATVIKQCRGWPLVHDLVTTDFPQIDVPDRCCRECIITVILNFQRGSCSQYRHQCVAGGGGKLSFPGNPWWEQGPPFYAEPALPIPGQPVEEQDITIMPADMDTGANVVRTTSGFGFGAIWHWPTNAPGFDTIHKVVKYTKSVVKMGAWVIVDMLPGNIPVYSFQVHDMTADLLTYRTADQGIVEELGTIASGQLVPTVDGYNEMAFLSYSDSDNA